jgi:hypothetical protein
MYEDVRKVLESLNIPCRKVVGLLTDKRVKYGTVANHQ